MHMDPNRPDITWEMSGRALNSDTDSDWNSDFEEQDEDTSHTVTVASRTSVSGEDSYDRRPSTPRARAKEVNVKWVPRQGWRFSETWFHAAYKEAVDTITSASRIPCRSLIHEHMLRGYLLDRDVYAIPDTCSRSNVISEQFLIRHDIRYSKACAPIVRLPNKQYLECLGAVDLPFRIHGEPDTNVLTFSVIRNCVHDVILGGEYLSEQGVSKQLQQYITWLPKFPVQDSTVAPALRVCLVDTPHQMIMGSIDGRIVSAFPDTGSDVNIMSQKSALKLGLRINSKASRRAILTFIDGSTVTTDGIITDVEWKFVKREEALYPDSNVVKRSKKSRIVDDWEFGRNATANNVYICNFYVLKSLSCPLILGSDLLLGSNAFEACADSFHTVHTILDSGLRPVKEVDIRLIKEQKEKKQRRPWHQRLLGRPKTSPSYLATLP